MPESWITLSIKSTMRWLQELKFLLDQNKKLVWFLNIVENYFIFFRNLLPRLHWTVGLPGTREQFEMWQ
jgi:hypothetical protein